MTTRRIRYDNDDDDKDKTTTTTTTMKMTATRRIQQRLSYDNEQRGYDDGEDAILYDEDDVTMTRI